MVELSSQLELFINNVEDEVADGSFCGARRPHVEDFGHEFFAEVTIKNGLIVKVK